VDIELFAQTLWRYRYVVVGGIVVALALAFLSFVRVQPFGDGPMFEYRQAETWGSTFTLQVTQRGFPEGRTQIQTELPQGVAPSDATLVFADPGRLVSLTQLYARLVNSDNVRAIMRREGPIYGRLTTRELTSDDGEALPILELTAVTKNPQRAVDRVLGQARAFQRYIQANQQRAGVAATNRVELTDVSGPTRPKVVASRSKTLPAIIFISMLIAVLALVLALENVRQRRRSDVEDNADTGAPIDVVSVEPTRTPTLRAAGQQAASRGRSAPMPRKRRRSHEG
jgi:hypothetical protein